MNRRMVSGLWFGERHEVEDFERLEPLRPWEEGVPLSWIGQRGKRLPPLPLGKLFLGALLWAMASEFVAFVPFLINVNRNTTIWSEQTEKTTYTPSDTIIIGAWFCVNLFASLGAWFVWMDGAFINHMRRLTPFFVLLGTIVIIPDAIFAGPNNLTGAAWCLIVFAVAVFTAVVLGRVVMYSAVLMAPFMIWMLYAAVVLAGVTFLDEAIVS